MENSFIQMSPEYLHLLAILGLPTLGLAIAVIWLCMWIDGRE